MPVVTPFFVALNSTHPYPGNATVPPPGSYIQPTDGEALWWKYTVGGVGLVVGIGAFVTGVYLCVVKWQERASGRASRTTPVTDLPDDALNTPGALGNIYEMETINNDPPPPYDATPAVVGLQQVRGDPSEHEIETPERLHRGLAAQGVASANVLADAGAIVASEHAA
ncbi:unnamed protein product [Alternaria alternata]